MKDLKFGAVVGRGSFATVHRGTWRGIEVALKRIRMPCGSGATTTNLPKEISIFRLYMSYKISIYTRVLILFF